MIKVTRSTESPNFCSVVYVAREGMYLDDTLAHHGIKKQRWGIRRWQNEDGSLTEAGKRRYGRVENLNANRTLKDIAKDQKLAIKLDRANKKLAIEQNKTAIKKTQEERRRMDLEAKEREEAKRLAEKNRKKEEAEKIAAEKERKALEKEQERKDAKAMKEERKKRTETAKKVSLMTDMELNDAIARLRKERELKNLSKSDMRLFIEDIAKSTIKNTVTDVATTTTKTVAYYLGSGGKDSVGMDLKDALQKSLKANLEKSFQSKGNKNNNNNNNNNNNSNNN